MQLLSMACLFLATKLEETARKHREIISVFHRVERRREGRSLDPLDLYGNVRPLTDDMFLGSTHRAAWRQAMHHACVSMTCHLVHAGIFREESSPGEG